MKKVLIFCLMLIISTIASYANEVKFIQVDSVKYSPSSEQSVSYFKNITVQNQSVLSWNHPFSGSTL